VLHTIERDGLVPRGARIAAAVSGGSDSVALVHILAELAPRAGFTLAGLAHLNHGLRGAAADEDERFCCELANRLSLPIEVGKADVRQLAREARSSIEVAAREARYGFFERSGAQLGADRMALGHTRDDQAETYLLRLLRGAGPGGLAGMRPRGGLTIRPLLDVTRRELRAFLAEIGVSFREDETNRDLGIPRNRVRHELIPYLTRNFSPAIVDVAARNAAIARADAEWLDRAAAEAADNVVRLMGPVIELDVPALKALPAALAMRVARRALETAGVREVGFEDVERLLELRTHSAGRFDLSGCRVTLEPGRLRLTPRMASRHGPAGSAEIQFDYRLVVPGEVEVPEAGLVVSAQPPAEDPVAASAPLSSRGPWVAVDAARLSFPLAVRNWRAGDRLQPLGLNGHKKLQDFFVDRKVPRADRWRVPLVVDAGARIVWVVGQTVSEEFRVTADSPAVLILRVRHSAGREPLPSPADKS